MTSVTLIKSSAPRVSDGTDARAAAAPRRPAFQLVDSALTPWILPPLLFFVWQSAASCGFVSSQILPAPPAVARAAVELTFNGQLPENILVSFRRAMSGFLVGGALAFALGLANGLSRLSAALTDTTVQMIRNIPNLSLIPLVILWLGIGEDAKLLLTVLGVFFPIYINTYHGVRTVDSHLVEMARSYGMNARALFTQVILPGALPSIFVGVRFALGVMWLTLIVAETIAANSGIGYMATQAREFMLVDVVILAILIYAALGKLADIAVRALEQRTLAWHPSFAKS